jgi:hypothetical protein
VTSRNLLTRLEMCDILGSLCGHAKFAAGVFQLLRDYRLTRDGFTKEGDRNLELLSGSVGHGAIFTLNIRERRGCSSITGRLTGAGSSPGGSLAG